MKRFLILLILLVFYSNQSLAVLDKKVGGKNAMYNLLIVDYNKFKTNFSKEVLEYCTSQFVTGAGVGQFIDIAQCEFDSTIQLLRKYELYVSPLYEITSSWGENNFNMTKNTAIALNRCNSKSCRDPIVESYSKSRKNLLTDYFKKLDDGMKKVATEENRKFYAQIEEKKNKGPNIGDNEEIAASSGSGFFVSKKGHMITNFHVIHGCSKVKTIYNGNEYDSSVIAIDKVNDLALIKANINNEKAFSVSNEGPQLLEDIIVAGFPLGKKVSAAIKATTGSVTAMSGMGDNYSEFQLDAAINSGNSGGPIINEKGNVIGVAVSKIVEKGVDSFNFGIKSSVLKTFASSNGITFLSPNSRPMKKADLGSLLTSATVYLDCWMTGKQLKQFLSQNKNSQKAFYSKFQK